MARRANQRTSKQRKRTSTQTFGIQKRARRKSSTALDSPSWGKLDRILLVKAIIPFLERRERIALCVSLLWCAKSSSVQHYLHKQLLELNFSSTCFLRDSVYCSTMFCNQMNKHSPHYDVFDALEKLLKQSILPRVQKEVKDIEFQAAHTHRQPDALSGEYFFESERRWLPASDATSERVFIGLLFALREDYLVADQHFEKDFVDSMLFHNWPYGSLKSRFLGQGQQYEGLEDAYFNPKSFLKSRWEVVLNYISCFLPLDHRLVFKNNIPAPNSVWEFIALIVLLSNMEEGQQRILAEQEHSTLRWVYTLAVLAYGLDQGLFGLVKTLHVSQRLISPKLAMETISRSEWFEFCSDLDCILSFKRSVHFPRFLQHLTNHSSLLEARSRISLLLQI